MTLIGWCPGGRSVADMLTRYDARAVRIFVGPGNPLPAWDGPILGPLVGRNIVVHLSFKTNATAEVLAWAARKPAGLLLLLTYAHEPEQQKYGDPTVVQYHTRWAELVPAFDGHPMRDEILLGPVYTRYWWQEQAEDLRWLVKQPVDFHGWDVYNNGSTYRTPDDLLSIPRQIAARTGVPYLVAELGALRLAGDGDGLGRSAWMRAMVAAVDSDGGLTACWYHKEEWDLTGPGSAGEQQTWRELIQEAPMAWSKGQPWRTVRSLDRLNEQIRAAYPQAVPPATPAASWGAIADSAHSSTSDHYPHFYSALGGTAVVCARDFPHAPKLGLDAHKLADRLRQSRDPRIAYIISNGRITSPGRGWQWGTYSGSDPHDTHIHVSTVRTAAADDPRDWQIGDEDMPLTQSDIGAVKAAILSDGGMQQLFTRVYQLGVNLAAMQTALAKLPALVGAEGTSPAELKAAFDALPKPEPIDVDGLAERLKASLPASTAISDEQLKRVLRDLLGSLDEAPQSAPE